METNNNQVKPDNYMVWAILTTLFCCLPFGIVAIVNASGVDTAWNCGNREEAVLKSQNAAKWCKWAALCGVIFIILYIVAIVAFGLGAAALADL